MIIDVHVHPPGGQDAGLAFLEGMHAGGVNLVVISCLPTNTYAPSPADIRIANVRAAALAAAAQGATRWLAFLSPRHDNCLGELAACLEGGAAGVKLLLPLKDDCGRLDEMFPLLEEVARRKMPVLIHVFGTTDDMAPGALDIRDFAELNARFPDIPLIAAHSGGNWRESLAVLRDCTPNAYVDVSGYYPERGMVEAIVEAVGAKRCLYGSDAPGRNPVAQLAKVALAQLDSDAMERVLWRSAAQLFRIDVRDLPDASPLAESAADPVDMRVDHFCFCGRWPYFDTPCESSQALDAELARHNVDTAYVADLGALHRTDLLLANARFLAAATGCVRLRPLAVVNPRAFDARQVLAQVPAHAAGVLISPFLHDWRVDDSQYAWLFDACSARGLPVWINCALHDIRVRHVSACWRSVCPQELLAFAQSAPPNRYVCQGVAIAPMRDILTRRQPGVEFQFEISRLVDYGDQFVQLIRLGLAGALVLGSEYPFRDMQCVRWIATRLPERIGAGGTASTGPEAAQMEGEPVVSRPGASPKPCLSE